MYQSLGTLADLIAATPWPLDFFSPQATLPDFLSSVYLIDYHVLPGTGDYSSEIWLAIDNELALSIPGIDGICLVVGGNAPGLTFLNPSLTLGAASSLTLKGIQIAVRFDASILKPTALNTGDPIDQFVEIQVEGAIRVNSSFDVDVSGFDAFRLTPAMIGNSGIIIAAGDVKLDLSRTSGIPEVIAAGFDESLIGVYIGEADVVLPPGLPALAPADLKLKNCVIGSGGVSGLLDAHYNPLFAAGQFNGPGAGDLFGIPFGLKDVTIEFKQNALIQSSLTGQLLLPFFDEPVDVQLGIDLDGNVSAQLTSTDPNGLRTVTKAGVLNMEVDSLGFELKNGVFLAKLSGKITPLIAGIDWPSFDVNELAIDSKGNVQLTGGWIDLPTSYSIDFYGATLEITKFGMGMTADGGKYIGMSGAVELAKGLPAGASVDGLRLTWYDDGREPNVSFNGIGLAFSTPAVEFVGAVSYSEDGGNHQFKGDLELTITACDLTLIGKAVFGTENGVKYFAIYVEGDFGTGIPLFATGISLYGFAGLLAVNYAPNKPQTMLWYSLDKTNSWFHKPQKGVVDIIRKWGPAAGAFAIGAGVTLGTETDDGYSFNGKFLLLMLCPGPVLMIDGSAAFLSRRDDPSEPPFHGLIVLDTIAGYFQVGLDAQWKSSKAQGEVADISGSMEVYFNYFNPTQWHLWLGKDTPMDERIQARLAKVFTANAYFMLDASRLKVGGWIGTAQSYHWGPVQAAMNVWLASDATVNFKPPQLHVDIQLHGQLAVQVFRFKLGIYLDAILSTDVFKPFHIRGELDITIQTWIKNFDIKLLLEWGPQRDHPVLYGTGAPLELAPVQSYGIEHLKSSTVWPLSGPNPVTMPWVPVDCRPYVTFAYPMNDAISVGVSSVDPGWTIIGDSSKAAGSARARYSLTNIALYKGTTLVGACPPQKSVDIIYGSWAPSIPGAAGGNNKLLLWSKNPLDFADKSGSWNPWLSSNLPGYPCADTSTETVCVDFQGLDLGRQLYGTWWDPQKPDFRFSWPDGWPRLISAVPVVQVGSGAPTPPVGLSTVGLLVPAVQPPVQGLLFPAITRKHYRTYVANSGGNATATNIPGDSVSVVDLVTREVIDIPGGMNPAQLALYGNNVYVCNRGDGTVTVIDTTTNQATKSIKVTEGPASIAISSNSARAFVPSDSVPVMSVIDLMSPSLTATSVKTGTPATRAIVTPDGKKLYLIHRDGISVLSADAVTPIGSIATIKTVAANSPGAMVIHPTAPTAWVSFPNQGGVQLFDTNADAFVGTVQGVGGGPKDLALSIDGKRLYAANVSQNAIAVLDTTTTPPSLLATIPTPTPAGLQMTPDGSALLVANTSTNTIAIVDPSQNQVVGPYIAAGQASDSFAVQEVQQQSGSVQVTVDLPPGASSVIVTWSGKGHLSGTVTQPAAQVPPLTVANGASLTIDAAKLGLTPASQSAPLAGKGIDQITLSSDQEWILIRVCVTRLKLAGGLAGQTKLNAASNQQVQLWGGATHLLEPGQTYELHVEWKAEVQGMGDLAGWSDSFSGGTALQFQTALPPSLGMVSDPNVPPKTPPEGTGLLDLSLYVRRTIPLTATPADQLPQITKPVFCGYDVTVEFNEDYVEQMYQMAGRDIDLILFDRNNEPVRDANGQLMILEDAWSSAPTLILTDTQTRWIDMLSANKCNLSQINPMSIPTSKVLCSNDGHVLAPDTVYEARLVPQLTSQPTLSPTGWATSTLSSGVEVWTPTAGAIPPWADYRVSVLVTLNNSAAVGILFGYTSAGYYEFTIDPAGKRRRLTQVNGGTQVAIREDFYSYSPGTDPAYRIRIEAVGSQVLISQNGAVVFIVSNATFLTGTVGLRPAGHLLADFGVSDLSTTAPVAYQFQFTTSQFTNFYHQIHSFQDEIWKPSVTTALDLSHAVTSSGLGVLPCATTAVPVPDLETRAYEAAATIVLGSASAQDPPRVDVTRLENGGTILGWLVRSSEPIDFSRTEIALAAANRIQVNAEVPGAVKITETELGEVESVTLLAREEIELSGYAIQYRQMPSALADELSNLRLWQEDGAITSGQIQGDQTWTDYRVSVVCRANLAGGIGIQFRYVDAQNYYAFTYDVLSGVQQIVKTVQGVSTILNSVTGDPAPGFPNAPAVLLTVSVQGSQITAYRAGQKVLQESDGDLSSGGASAFSSGNASAQFDSFEVHLLPNELFALLHGSFSTAAITTWQNATDSSGLRLSAIGSASWTDVIVRARLRRIGPGTIGLLLRYQDPNNHYRLLFTDIERRLDRVVEGVSTTLWTSPVPGSLPANQVCEIVVSLIGTALSIFQDSVPACEVVDPSLVSGSIGLCAIPGSDLAVSQLVVYPPDLAFSNWILRDQFQQLSTDWNFVDAGDQNGPSTWQVANGRLMQTSAIHDSSTDPIAKRGTTAVRGASTSKDVRIVTRLLAQQAGAIGVVFGYQDTNNFYRFSMDPGAGYRRLVSCIDGKMSQLWSDSVTFGLQHECVLTLDLIDGYAKGWMDGVEMFQSNLSPELSGLVGLYCSGNSGGSFADFRSGAPAWNSYYKFGAELPLSAGNRVKIASAKGIPAANHRTSIRVAGDLDDPNFNRLPPNGVHLRIVAPDQSVTHGREFVPGSEATAVPFQALRKADGTGVLLAPVSSIDPGQTVRLSFQYHRDNGVVAYTEAGDPGDEMVFLDLPPDAMG